MKIIALFTAFFLSLSTHAEDAHVLLFLSSPDQADSLGFNLVESLPAVVYDEIMEGRVTLWDSPKKEDRIGAKTLGQIERSSGAEFKVTSQLFIYEDWKREKKSLFTRTIGFYFSSKNSSGEETAFGFVSYEDLDSILDATIIPANANGSCNLTFGEVIRQKMYYFNIVQYGDRQIATLEESVQIKNEVRHLLPRKIQTEEEQCKLIRYAIEDDPLSTDESVLRSRQFLSVMEKYLKESPEFFLNYGGDRLTRQPAKYRIIVKHVEVEEYWVLQENGIDYSLSSMVIQVNDSMLNPMSAAEIQNLDAVIAFKPVHDFLKEKEFYFRILKINNQEIPKEQAAAFLEGLREMKWRHLIEWARYQ